MRMGAESLALQRSGMRSTIPAVSKTAQRYETLAAYGRAHGYPKLHGPAVHTWVKQRFLPRATIDHPAFGVRSIVEPIVTGRQLLRFCHYRYDESLRDTRVIGALLWLDGFDIPFDMVRRGLTVVARSPWRLVELTQRLSTRSEVDADAINAAAVAAIYHHRVPEKLGVETTPGMAEGLAAYLGQLLGVGIPSDLDVLDEFAKLAGLDRARRDRIPGVMEPPLRERPGEALSRIAPALAVAELEKTIARASEEELVAARDVAERIAASLVRYAQLAEAADRPGFAGLGPLTRMPFTTVRLETLLASLAFSSQARELAENLPAESHSG